MVLKLGSTGQAVKDLQTFLKLTADGEFGKKTEKAVKKWQTENGLAADGVVGPKTWAEMGLATTDISENSGSVLDIKQSFLPNGEYFAGPTKKRWIFLHHTAGWHNPFNTISSWGRDTRGAVATEFVLGGPSVKGDDFSHDGVLVQAFPTGGYGWHLGTGSRTMHTCSVGIEVCNFGQLKDGKTYVGTPVTPSQIVTLPKAFRGYTQFHRYSDEQIKVLKDWILFVAGRDGIDPRVGLVELIKQKGADAFDHFDVALCEKKPGMWTHTNVRKDKIDMFPQPELIDMLLSL